LDISASRRHGRPPYPDRYVHFMLSQYFYPIPVIFTLVHLKSKRSHLDYWDEPKNYPIFSDFRYIQTDMSIFSSGYIGNGHIANDVIKCIRIPIYPFLIYRFSDKPPFLPAPVSNPYETCIWFVKFNHWSRLSNSSST
jgi:hypothetical protein